MRVRVRGEYRMRDRGENKLIPNPKTIHTTHPIPSS